MDQSMDAPVTSPTTLDPQTPAESQAVVGTPAPDIVSPGFRERGGMRRRLRFLRKARELAYRDLGGLVFEMHRLGQRRDELISAKLATLSHIDVELRAIESALGERQGVTVLREAGVAACPRCAAIHSSEDRFCPACGMPMGRHVERPIAATPPAPLIPPPGDLGPPPGDPGPPTSEPGLRPSDPGPPPSVDAQSQPTRAFEPPTVSFGAPPTPDLPGGPATGETTQE
jgi:hypothetical protein